MVRSKQVWQSTKQGRKVAVRCSKKHINRLCIERWGKCKTHRNAIQFNAKRYWIGLHTINTAAGDCSLPTIVGRRPRHCQGSSTKCLMPQNINDLRDQYPQGVSKWVSIWTIWKDHIPQFLHRLQNEEKPMQNNFEAPVWLLKMVFECSIAFAWLDKFHVQHERGATKPFDLAYVPFHIWKTIQYEYTFINTQWQYDKSLRR